MKQTVEVRAIENGTVIDHIPAESLFKVIRLLNLESVTNQITFGANFHSSRMGRKAIIKVTDVYFADSQVNYLALVAPQACINTIKDYKVEQKRQIDVPERVDGMVRCANPMCITNHETITTHFTVSMVEGQISLLCRYCEKSTMGSQIQISEGI